MECNIVNADIFAWHCPNPIPYTPNLDWYVDKQRSNDSAIYTAKLNGIAEGEVIGEARGIEKGLSLSEAKKKLGVKLSPTTRQERNFASQQTHTYL